MGRKSLVSVYWFEVPRAIQLGLVLQSKGRLEIVESEYRFCQCMIDNTETSVTRMQLQIQNSGYQNCLDAS